MITVVGLGNSDGDVTIKGSCAIDNAEVVIVKTALTDTYKTFEGMENITCDFIYESTANFNDLNEKLSQFVLSHRAKNVVYCVDGNGYDDRSVMLLTQLDKSIKIIAGVGSEAYSLVNHPNVNYLSISAYELDDCSFDYDSAKTTLVIKDIDSEFIAGEVKIFLTRSIGEEEEIGFFNGYESNRIPVYELDRQEKYSYLNTVIVTPREFISKGAYNYMDLLRVMRILRGDGGCQWDSAQTHSSIRGNVIEEAYELVEAINNDDIDNIIEESGDVILQGAFHTIIGEDEGEFEAYEVLTALCKKLITRHTHIFGNVVANNKEEALAAWEAAKAKEKSQATMASKMDGVAKELPSLIRAVKIQKIAKKFGFDFAKEDDVVSKINEELQELLSAKGDWQIENESGDLLFAVTNLLRFRNINPEVALSRANEKFIDRCNRVLRLAEDLHLDVAKLSAKEFDKLWEEAKKAQKAVLGGNDK